MASSSLDTVQAQLESVVEAALGQHHMRMQEKLATLFRSSAPGDGFLGGPFQDQFLDFLSKLYDGYGRRIYELWRIKSKCRLQGFKTLHLAALAGYTNLCKALVLTFGYNVNATSFEGYDTPLHMATWANHVATVACLIDLGANVNIKGQMGYTPLHTATLEGHPELVQLLISRGSDTEATSAIGTPLQCAAQKSHIMSMKVLLENHVNPNSASHYCILTPLMLSVIHNSLECLKLLIKDGANPDIGACGTTPLCYAASRGLNEIVKCLLNAGANPNAVDLYDLTPLENAALNVNYVCMWTLFPLTSPPQCWPNWSVSEITRHMCSEDNKKQMELKKNEVFWRTKMEGYEAAKRKEYFNAVHWYTMAIDAYPTDITLYSSRSLSFIFLFDGEKALPDAQSCVRMNPYWSTAHYIEGLAWELLNNYPMALEAFSMALQLEPDNLEFQNAFWSTRGAMTSSR